MERLKKWGLPILTGAVVLAAVLLPRQISALKDLRTLEAIHTEPLAEGDLTIQETTLPQRLELLGRAIRASDRAVYSTTQPLEELEESGAERAEGAFSQGMGYLSEWGILPESVDLTALDFQGGSRAVYIQADGALSASMLYLQGKTDSRDDLWLVVDEETGLPVWIDCTLRSAKEDLPSAEVLCQRSCSGLALETVQRGPAVWEVEGAGGLVYSASVERVSGRICIEPMGFAQDLFGEEDSTEGPGGK